jgi:hypothetical protein
MVHRSIRSFKNVPLGHFLEFIQPPSWTLHKTVLRYTNNKKVAFCFSWHPLENAVDLYLEMDMDSDTDMDTDTDIDRDTSKDCQHMSISV